MYKGELHHGIRRKVIDHLRESAQRRLFDNSDDSVGSGMVGAPACGDVMKLRIKVNNEGIIEDARFKTYGLRFCYRLQLHSLPNG